MDDCVCTKESAESRRATADTLLTSCSAAELVNNFPIRRGTRMRCSEAALYEGRTAAAKQSESAVDPDGRGPPNRSLAEMSGGHFSTRPQSRELESRRRNDSPRTPSDRSALRTINLSNVSDKNPIKTFLFFPSCAKSSLNAERDNLSYL